jgi:hypothetical protein
MQGNNACFDRLSPRKAELEKKPVADVAVSE